MGEWEIMIVWLVASIVSGQNVCRHAESAQRFRPLVVVGPRWRKPRLLFTTAFGPASWSEYSRLGSGKRYKLINR